MILESNHYNTKKVIIHLFDKNCRKVINIYIAENESEVSRIYNLDKNLIAIKGNFKISNNILKLRNLTFNYSLKDAYENVNGVLRLRYLHQDLVIKLCNMSLSFAVSYDVHILNNKMISYFEYRFLDDLIFTTLSGEDILQIYDNLFYENPKFV